MLVLWKCWATMSRVDDEYIARLELKVNQLQARLFQVENEAIALATANGELRSELHELKEATKHGAV